MKKKTILFLSIYMVINGEASRVNFLVVFLLLAFWLVPLTYLQLIFIVYYDYWLRSIDQHREHLTLIAKWYRSTVLQS